MMKPAPGNQSDRVAERSTTGLRWYSYVVLAVCSLALYVDLFTDNEWPWSLVGPLSWVLITIAWLLLDRSGRETRPTRDR
jgi:hypothetical protein